MRRYWYLAVAAAIASALAVLPAMPAFAASDVLTVGSAGGSSVNVGDHLTANLESGTSATFFSSTTGTSGVTCTVSDFSATATGNPAAPGTAAADLTAQSFDPAHCTINVAFTRGVRSITVNNLPYDTAISSDGTVKITTKTGDPVQTTVVIIPLFGSDITCVYQAPEIDGTTSNTDNSIKFSNVQFTKVSGSGTCFSTAFFSGTYAPVTDTDQGGQSVFTN